MPSKNSGKPSEAELQAAYNLGFNQGFRSARPMLRPEDGPLVQAMILNTFILAAKRELRGENRAYNDPHQ